MYNHDVYTFSFLDHAFIIIALQNLYIAGVTRIDDFKY